MTNKLKETMFLLNDHKRQPSLYKNIYTAEERSSSSYKLAQLHTVLFFAVCEWLMSLIVLAIHVHCVHFWLTTLHMLLSQQNCNKNNCHIMLKN